MSHHERIRIGMVGGGQGAFIGAVHRIALRMDGHFDLVAGCFSRDLENTLATAAELSIAATRAYPTLEAMIAAERKLPESERIEAVAIVTPNHLHHSAAMACLDAGFHVICDKPLCVSESEAQELVAKVKDSGRIFALTHNYTGYPMIQEARERVLSGSLGTLRKVYVEYLQGWLSSDLEVSGQKQAAWRTDPKQSGPVGALGDIGTHAFNLLEHVSGLKVESLYAVLNTFVQGRKLDDDDMALLKLSNGVTGTLCASQVCFGKENALSLRIFGTEGALEWRQEHPNDLWLTGKDGVVSRLRTGAEASGEASKALTRTPPGHPEGYLEGFANLYTSFALKLRGHPAENRPLPTVHDGARGLAFIAACLRSSTSQHWESL